MFKKQPRYSSNAVSGLLNIFKAFKVSVDILWYGFFYFWDIFRELLNVFLSTLYAVAGVLWYGTLVGLIMDVNMDFAYWRTYLPGSIENIQPTLLAQIFVALNYLTIIGGAWDLLMCQGERLQWAFGLDWPKLTFHLSDKPMVYAPAASVSQRFSHINPLRTLIWTDQPKQPIESKLNPHAPSVAQPLNVPSCMSIR